MQQLCLVVCLEMAYNNITLLSNYIMVSFQRKRLRIKYSNNIHLLVEKLTIHNLSAPYRLGICELKDNHAHVVLDPTKHN